MENYDFCSIPGWYPVLSGHTFITTFVPLRDAAVAALAAGNTDLEDPAVREAVESLRRPLKGVPGSAFIGVDRCSPTDTERFAARRGSVHSAGSVWKVLASSAKVRASAAAGEVANICLRPFRRINRMREFRLFIRDGELLAASQYNLTRYFSRLESRRDVYWKMLTEFVGGISWLLPSGRLALDAYITASDSILILDINPWGPPTDPLMARDWSRDWNAVSGLLLMEPPVKLDGDVSVSF